MEQWSEKGLASQAEPLPATSKKRERIAPSVANGAKNRFRWAAGILLMEVMKSWGGELPQLFRGLRNLPQTRRELTAAEVTVELAAS